MRIVGIDLSLKCTGLCELSSQGYTVTSLRTDAKLPVEERIAAISLFVMRSVDPGCHVFIENHSFKNNRPGGRQIAELTGVIKNNLVSCHVPFSVVAPATLKKWATGYGGSANKPVEKCLVLHDMAIKTGGIRATNEDEADALALAHFGWHVLNPGMSRKFRIAYMEPCELNDTEKATIAAFLAPKVKKLRKRKEKSA